MKRIVQTTMLILGLSAQAAFGAEGNYLNLKAGTFSLDDGKLAPPGSDKIQFESGTAVSIAYGHDFGGQRLEVEFASRENELESYQSFEASGDYKGISLTVNGYLDFENRSFVTPYIGIGAGLADVSSNHAAIYTPAKVDLASGSSTVVAFQGMAGLALEISQSWLVDIGVNFFTTTDPEFEYISSGQEVESSYAGSAVTISARVVF